MTDTSRETVEALRAALRSSAAFSDVLRDSANTLAALLDERDAAREYVKVHAGLTATDRESEIHALDGAINVLEHTVRECQQDIEKREQRIRFLESEFARESDLRRKLQTDAENSRERIRDLEAEVKSLDNFLHLEREAAKQNLERAERAEAECDKLAAELAQVKQCRDEYGDEIDVANARWERDAAKLDAVKTFIANRSVIGGMDRMCLQVILADIDEPKDSITFNTDDLGPATDIDGNPLADTDEGNSK